MESNFISAMYSELRLQTELMAQMLQCLALINHHLLDPSEAMKYSDILSQSQSLITDLNARRKELLADLKLSV